MGDAPPGEMMRRAVGHRCERHLDRLRPVEQPQRPQRRLALDALRPCGLRRGRQMMLRRRRPAPRVRGCGCPAADARPRACRRCARRCGRSARRVRHCHGHWRRDRAAAAPRFRCGWRTGGSRSKPKPGSSGSSSASSRSRNRRSIMSALRHRPAGVDGNRAHRAVGAEETRFQPPRALALPVHRRDQHAASADSVIAITVSVATGSGKRFSTM